VNHSKFQDDWIFKFSWLETNFSKDRLFCKLCRNNGLSNVFAKEGSKNLQRSALIDHQNSIDHKSSVNKESELHHKTQTKISVLFDTRKDAKDSVLENHFRTCYFIAKNNLPINIALDLNYLCKANGVQILDHYKHSNVARSIILSIAEFVDLELIKEIKKADFISLMIDEADDEGEKKQFIIVLRYALDMNVMEKYFAIVQVTDASAEGLFKFVSHLLTLEEVDTNKITSVATDGAPAMAGIRKGFTTLFKNNFPHSKSIHCMNHRLKLAINSFMTEFKLDQLEKTLYCLCDYIHDSYLRRLTFERVQKDKGQSILSIIIPFHNRWWAMYNALKRILERYSEIIETLHIIASESGDPRATGYALFLEKYENILNIVLLVDILRFTECLELQLQKKV